MVQICTQTCDKPIVVRIVVRWHKSPPIFFRYKEPPRSQQYLVLIKDKACSTYSAYTTTIKCAHKAYSMDTNNQQVRNSTWPLSKARCRTQEVSLSMSEHNLLFFLLLELTHSAVFAHAAPSFFSCEHMPTLNVLRPYW